MVVVRGVKAPVLSIAKGDQRRRQRASVLQAEDLTSCTFLATGRDHELHPPAIMKQLALRRLCGTASVNLMHYGRSSGVLLDAESHALQLAQPAERPRMTVSKFLG